MSNRQIEFITAAGLARATIHPAGTGGALRGVLLLGHGAGGGLEARDLGALATALPALGVCVIGVEQPWRVAGRKVATPPASLDLAWNSVVGELSASGELRHPLVVGGRSAGARVAVRSAGVLGADGCVTLAFPLHPPGRPERSRVGELTACSVPTLVVQGDRDPFGRPEEFPTGTRLARVAAADHSFAVSARSGVSADEVAAAIVTAVAGWWAEVFHAPTGIDLEPAGVVRGVRAPGAGA